MPYRVRPDTLRPANLDRPSWQWSQRDWTVFKAACHSTEKQEALRTQVVKEIRNGKRVADLAEHGKLSRQYIYVLLATQERIDRWKMARFHERRGNLGRPLDMGGPRDEWLERDIDDQLEGL